MRNKIELPFVKSGMTVRDLEAAANTLETILEAYDKYGESDPEEFAVRVLQYRGGYKLSSEK